MPSRYGLVVLLIFVVASFVVNGLLTGGSTGQAHADGAELLAHWAFEEPAGSAVALDSTPNGHDGEIEGAQRVDGAVGGALRFDNVDDYVRVIDNADFDGMDELTVQAWIFPLAHEFANAGTIVAKWGMLGGVDDSFWLLHQEDYIQNTVSGFGIPGPTENSFAFDVDAALPLNEWSLITGTYERGVATTVYYNDVLIAIGPAKDGSVPENGQDLFIGALFPGTAHFNGCIDEVKIWDGIVNPDSVVVPSGGCVPSGAELLAHWAFEEPNFTAVALDSTPNGHDGAVVGDGSRPTGVVGNALRLGGSRYVTIPDAPGLDGMDELTLDLWAFIESLPSPHGGLLAKWGSGGPSDDSYQLVLNGSDGRVGLSVSEGGSDAKLTQRTTLTELPLGKWVRITAQWSALDGVKILFNGNTQPIGGPCPSCGEDTDFAQDTTQPVWIGRHETGSFMTGCIDEVKIWDGIVDPDFVTPPTSPCGAVTGILHDFWVGGQPDLYLMDLDGGNDRPIVTTGLCESAGELSADGTRIAYTEWVCGSDEYRVKIVNSDGSDNIEIDRGNFYGQPTWAPDGKTVAIRCGVSGICIMPVPGGGATQIFDTTTVGLIGPSQLNWSPDGNVILFVASAGACEGRIYTVDLAGNATQFIDDNLSQPVWSLDGSEIAFTSGVCSIGTVEIAKADGSQRNVVPGLLGDPRPFGWLGKDTLAIFENTTPGEIYSVHRLGGNKRILRSFTSTASGLDTRGEVAPSRESRVVWTSIRDGNLEIYSSRPDGTDVRRLTDHPDLDFDPELSSDGTTVVFASDRTGSNEIWTLPSDGSGTPTQLTTFGAHSAGPTYSPVAPEIAFHSTKDGNFEIYTLNLITLALERHTTDGGEDHDPDYAPDGQRLVFNSNTNEITVKERFSASSTVVSAQDDLHPAWHPEDERIAFSSTRSGPRRIYEMDLPSGVTTVLSPLGLGPGGGDGQLSGPSYSPDGQSIAFYESTSPNQEIYLMNLDGSGVVNLSRTPGDDCCPHWGVSPARPSTIGRIVYDSDKDSPDHIFIVNADGTADRKITDGSSRNLVPHWSRDGSRIVFISNRDGGTFEVYTMDDDGNNLERLTFGLDADHPTWSGDGSEIVFASIVGSTADLVVMDSNGDNQHSIISGLTLTPFADWSPVSDSIAFQANDVDGDDEIFTIDSNGSNLEQLTFNTADDLIPSWSPDGTRIAFSSERNGGRDLFLMNADGSSPTNLTRDGELNGSPHWSPDGTSLVWDSHINVLKDLFTINVQGGLLSLIAFGPSTDESASWGPPTVPETPTNVRATPGSEVVSVNWTRPIDHGGAPVTSYTVTASPGGVTRTVLGTVTATRLTGLNNNVNYTITVVASNSIGDSAPSEASNAVITRAGGTTLSPFAPDPPSDLPVQHPNSQGMRVGDFYYVGPGNINSQGVNTQRFDRTVILESGVATTTWSNVGSTDQPHSQAIVTATDDDFYVLGNQQDFTQNTVFRLPINLDGTLGPQVAEPPMIVDRHAGGAFTHDGFLYVVGGQSGSNPTVLSVERARINADGSLGPWEITPPLETAQRSYALVKTDRYVWLLGGSGTFPPRGVIQRALLMPMGEIGRWEDLTGFPINFRTQPAALVAGDCILYMGGNNNDGGTYATVTQCIRLDANDEVTSIDDLDGELFFMRDNPHAWSNGTHVFVTGGNNSPGNAIRTQTEVGLITALATGDVTPPELTVPDPITVEGDTTGGAEDTSPPIAAFLSAATATDDTDPSPTITNDAPAFFPVNVTTDVTFTATDISGNSASATSSVTVVDTTNPELTIPPDVTFEGNAPGGATSVPLGSASATDFVDPAPVITNDAPAFFPLGTTDVIWTATDASDNETSEIQKVTVVDTTGPELTLTVSPDTLWPPDHKMRDIEVVVTFSDVVDDSSTVTFSVTSSEPDDAPGGGDGRTIGDIDTSGLSDNGGTLGLRSERSGSGPGRVYTVTYTVTDGSGNSTSASATVTVPHSQAGGKNK